jgi:hypothetical protein
MNQASTRMKEWCGSQLEQSRNFNAFQTITALIFCSIFKSIIQTVTAMFLKFNKHHARKRRFKTDLKYGNLKYS